MLLQISHFFYTMQTLNSRALSFFILLSVMENQSNIDQAFEKHLTESARDIPWIKALCFGILRTQSILDFLIDGFSKKPLGKKDLPLKIIGYIGLYQLLFMDTKAHAAIFETVELAKQQRLQHASGFVNALLQKVARSGKVILDTIPVEATYNHPAWLIAKIKAAYPNDWQSIIAENNKHPPLFLRINQRKTNRTEYCNVILAKAGIQAKCHASLDPRFREDDSSLELLDPIDIKTLPGFNEGLFSVQDLSAQQSALLLDLQDGQVVLDACAAPGGKACHILEMAEVKLIASDQDAKRMERVLQNLNRLGLQAETKISDASALEFPNHYFDRILLDAPCSATGVIRRHPDIRLLRREEDIQNLANTQQKILSHLWPMLKPGGILLYATCSILPEENDEVISSFLSKTADASITPLNFESGQQTQHGWQFLPSSHGGDGFYYSKLMRTS